MRKFEALSPELSQRMAEDRRFISCPPPGCDDNLALRRLALDTDLPTVWRPSFIKDVDKIMHCPYYNRYTDKTQVFSLIKNDDITRRSLHVQLVSRIARTIGRALNLNLDLIEAIALGHDIGHTPFGHAGEAYLDQLSFQYSGRHFSHNIHSLRVLDGIFPLNLTLQTLSGIGGHNGEIEMSEYHPFPIDSFEEFDAMVEECYIHKAAANRLQPNTLEGCVVRICDIIAYLGKDRQDAQKHHAGQCQCHPFLHGCFHIVSSFFHRHPGNVKGCFFFVSCATGFPGGRAREAGGRGSDTTASQPAGSPGC